MTERTLTVEDLRQAAPLILECIDFRTREGNALWLARRGYSEGTYHVYASAGASGNSTGFLDDVYKQNPSVVKALDHEDCGFYKANGLYVNGNEPHQAHHHNLESLGATLHDLNPYVDYRYNLLHLNREQRKRHTCPAVVIELGEPDIVKATRQTMAELGLANDYDKIARPYTLSATDQSIWDNLKISLRLHHPTRLFIFDRSKQNAEDLSATALDIDSNLAITRVIVDKLSQPSRFATITG